MQDVRFYSQFAHPDSMFYELASRANVGSEYIRLLRSLLPAADWSLDVRSPWLYVHPPNTDTVPPPQQGLKIHVSCVIDTAIETLRLASKICFENAVAFKCTSTPDDLLRLLCKTSERAVSGKFITVYPTDRDQFKKVISELAEVLEDFPGQDVLSDHRFSENAPVFYRYGAFAGHVFLDETGAIQSGLQTPDGSIIPDTRLPYFELPEWVEDPFAEEFEAGPASEEEEANDFLRNGTYEVVDALHYTNSGGLYLAKTADGETVVIKEARPYIIMDAQGNDAVARLKKEYDTLRRIQHLGIAPQPIEFFFEDSHHFFAMAYISDGEPIQALSLDTASLLRVAENLAASIEHLHAMGIVHNDISPSNALRTAGNGVCLVDFEHAEFTETPELFKQDTYGFGSVLLWALTGINTFLALKDSAPRFFLELENVRCPANLRELIQRCLSEAPHVRPDAPTLLKEIQHIRRSSVDALPKTPPPDTRSAQIDFSSDIDRIVTFIKSTAEFDRRDRLFPADPAVFASNPISWAFGACGVALVLKQMNDTRSDAAWHEDVLAWILSHQVKVTVERYAPGLYTGISGISAALFALGENDYAIRLMHENLRHPMLRQLSDGLMYGQSGVGLAALIAHRYTEDTTFLDAAVRIANSIIDTETDDFSIGEGTAGIAYFYLYLFIVTGEKKWMKMGKKFIGSAVENALNEAQSRVYLYGSAGVAHTLMRYESVFPSKTESDMKEILQRLLRPSVVTPWRDVDAVNPSFFYGDSGLGQLCLEAWHFTQDDQYQHMAIQLAERICFGFGCERDEGLAFPGLRLLKLSNDFVTGAAGVLLFLTNISNSSSSQRLPTGFDVLLPPN